MKLSIAITVWLGSLAIGVWQLEQYANGPGASADPRPGWPAFSLIERAESAPTLVMFVHPKCPCSRASIGELNRVCTRSGDAVRVFVAFVAPEGSDEDWSDTDLFRSADGIPEVRTLVDVGGREAEMFGAKTSGQTFLYGADGSLLFSGGITAARGHHGDNVGRTFVERQIAQPSSTIQHTAVFGCALFAPTRLVTYTR